MTITGYKFIYLDNAASTKVDDVVFKSMSPYFSSQYANPSSAHSFGEHAQNAIQKARAALAEKLHCSPEEIMFTSGGTEANNLAIVGLAHALKHKGNHIITSQIEHPSILEPCRYLEQNGFRVTYLPVDAEGIVSPKTMINSLRPDTILVSIMHVNNEIGTIQPIEELGRISKEAGAVFHTDAIQSFMKIPINMETIDSCSLSAHKIHGPKGVGALFVRNGIPISKLLFGGEQEQNHRAGTENVAGIVGFGAAVEQNIDIKKMKHQRDNMIKHLLSIQDTKLNGSQEKRLPNNVNISFKGIEAETLLNHLSEHGIMASMGSACKSHTLHPSHVLRAIGLDEELALGTIRLTLSKYTTDNEIKHAIKTIKSIVQSLRSLR